MEHAFLIQILLMLVIAIVAIALLTKVGLPAILAFLLTGVISGPSGFHWFTQQQMHFVAELGVVLLMFTLGLEFSVPRLWAMRRTVFGVGTIQVVATTVLAMVVGVLCGLSWSQAFVIGTAIALSSTAIVLQLFSDQGWLRLRHGELSVSVLLFQDIAVVPLLILLPFLATNGEPLIVSSIALALLKGILAFFVLMAFGKWALPRIFDEIAKTRSDELFVLSTLAVALVTGAFTDWLGLSMALGAFMAGMLLGESQYRRQLEADIRPFRDLLMGLFFISIGMMLHVEHVMQFWWQILLLLLAIVLGKMLVLHVLLKLSGESFTVSLSTAMSLAQAGEFSFVVLALAVNYQLLTHEMSTIVVMAAVLSMSVSPWLVRHSVDFSKWLEGKRHAPVTDDVLPNCADYQDLVVIFGYGRVGQTIARFLKSEAVPYMVLDLDPARVTDARLAGEPIYFGDACKHTILTQIDIQQAKMVVITFGELRHLEEVVHLCKLLAPNAKVLVRTRDDTDLDALLNAGASQVIPESLEGSLMLVSQVLHQCGVPLARIFQRLESERRNHYPFLHGFFSGVEDGFLLESLHTVALPANANAVGKAVGEIAWTELQVELKAIRRNGAEEEYPAPEWEFNAGDILVLMGKPRRLENAEAQLLQG